MSEYRKMIKRKIEAQEKFCGGINSPFYAPRNGICWRCGKQIFDMIDVTMAGSKIVSGCPYCHRSYVS